jgi:hypothetical protein
MTKIKKEVTDDVYEKWSNLRNKVLNSVDITINVNINEDDKIAFIKPLFEQNEYTNKAFKSDMKDLKLIKFINVEIKNKKVEGHQVLYSGTIKTNVNTQIFTDINNRFAIMAG